MIILCDYMKWTYQEYTSQPCWFIDLLNEKTIEDARHSNQKYGKSKTKHHH